MGKGLDQIFCQRRHTNSQQAHEECSTSRTIRECKSKLQCDILHTQQGGYYQKKKRKQGLVRMWRN